MRWLKAYSIFVVMFLWSPLGFIFYKGLSVDAFDKLLGNHEVVSALLQSGVLAASTCVFASLFGLLTAFALPGLPPWAKRLVSSSLVLPLVLPEIAFGLAYLVWYQKLKLELGWGTLLLSHVAFTFCYAVLVLKTSIEGIDWTLKDAASDLGAGAISIFRHAVFPQLVPGLLASSMMAFSLSLDDFLISFFVKGIEQVTLPIKIYSMMRLRIGPEIYALSVILFCISLISVLITQVWLTKSQKH